MLLTVIRTKHGYSRKPLFQYAYGRLTNTRNSRSTVKYRAHHVRFRVFTPRNYNARRTMTLVTFYISLPLAHACDCIHFNATIKRGCNVPAGRSDDGFASASSATTASPDDDAAAPPSTASGSSSSTHNQRPIIPGAHAGASDAYYSAGTGATCTARAPLCRVSFRLIMLISGSCNCCCGQRVRPAGSCVPVPGRTTPPELLAGGEEPLAARPLDGPRPPASPRPSSVAFASRVGHLFLLWSVESQLQQPSPIGRSEAPELCASPRGDERRPSSLGCFQSPRPEERAPH